VGHPYTRTWLDSQDIFFKNLVYVPFTRSREPATLGSRGGHGVDIKRVVGRNIRMARKAQGLSQLVLAERSELSADFIGKVERGTTSPSIESLKAIATAMNLSLGDLFAGELQADSSQEALIELIGLCRGQAREDIALVVGIAQLIFQGRQDRSRRP
jgi:transcriptional regulator with XRE-family HTH domain